MNRNQLRLIKARLLSLTVMVVFLGGLAVPMGSGLALAAKTQTLAPDRIKREAANFLREKLSWAKDEMELAIHYQGGEIPLPDGLLAMEFSMSGRTDRAGRIPLSMQIRVNDVYLRRIRLSADVTVMQKVIRTTRQIDRGEMITEHDVRVEEVATRRPRQKVANRLSEVVGYEAARNLREGRILLAHSVRRPVLVHKGDRVVIVLKRGLMKITAPGIARGKGFEGSLVEVTNLQSKKTVFARILDRNTVEVQF
jgi:flagella basal body P-ring formation protein FlgA